ncbi:MAG: helix-turn-helix domain-containing protein [Balneolaceae bacterium]
MKNLEYTKIKTQEQYDRYCDILKDFLFNENENTDKIDHIELLTLLIETWDQEKFNDGEYDPVKLLVSLMDDHGLKQKDIAKICNVGTSFVSEIINYKKYISKNIVRKLADYFKISQESLNKAYKIKSDFILVNDVSEFNFYLEGSSGYMDINNLYTKEILYPKRTSKAKAYGRLFNLNVVGDC